MSRIPKADRLQRVMGLILFLQESERVGCAGLAMARSFRPSLLTREGSVRPAIMPRMQSPDQASEELQVNENKGSLSNRFGRGFHFCNPVQPRRFQIWTALHGVKRWAQLAPTLGLWFSLPVFGSFLPFSVILQAPIQGVALVVNTLAEALAGLGVSIIGASVRALELRIARADVVRKLVDDDH